MRKIFFAFVFAILSVQVAFAQDWLSLFVGSANKYASVELSDYRQRLSVEYGIPGSALDGYYRQCGNDWGNVGLALEIGRSSGRNMGEVCKYYKRYHKHGWNRVLLELGIRPGAACYDGFYERLHHHHDAWDKHYKNYCDRHGKKHGKRHGRKHDNGKHKGHYKNRHK